MCGFSGFLTFKGFDYKEAHNIVSTMTNTLEHRGPDDSGVWLDADVGVALGHRRLSILDLSLAGSQPMTSLSGRYILIFNGEVYNHLEIRKTLDKLNLANWRGSSDTETLLAGFDCWGVEKTVKKIVGMFAFSVWDREKRVLTLARDRMGQKPLYYGWQAGVFLFGSELKSLCIHPNFIGETNYDVLEDYLRLGSIPAPYSIYKEIFKLMPGTIVNIPFDAVPGAGFNTKTYWSLKQVAEYGINNPFEEGDNRAIELLEDTLLQSIRSQCLSDVPLGAFLSGGVDSSLIVALLQSVGKRKVKTFTVGFEEEKYNEAAHADAVAKYLGANHTAIILSEDDIVNSIPNINKVYDEPFSDSSASLQVAILARKDVKVTLSGDGADELFGGYSFYPTMANILNVNRRIPEFIKKSLSKFILKLSPSVLTNIFSPFLFVLKKSTSIPVGLRIHQLVLALLEANHSAAFNFMKANGMVEASLLCNKKLANGKSSESFQAKDTLQSLLYYDQKTYLSSDILVKADIPSMSVGLENRAPFLDHRVVELAWKLPVNMKVRGDVSKWVLRQVLYKYVPSKLVDRPKKGFNLPVDSWLRGPLREWVEDSLNSDVLQRQGYFDANKVQMILKQHMDNKFNWQAILWRLTAFQAWAQKK